MEGGRKGLRERGRGREIEVERERNRQGEKMKRGGRRDWE